MWPRWSALPPPARERVVTHELTHAALADTTSGRTPAWLVEGVALYVSGDRRTADASRLVRGDVAGFSAAQASAAHRALSLDALARPGAIGRLRGTGQAAAYAFSSAAAFRIAERYGRARLLRLYQAFNDEELRGRPGPAVADRAARRVLGTSIPAWSATCAGTRRRREQIPRRLAAVPRALRATRAGAAGPAPRLPNLDRAMPELPEVETIRRHLAPRVEGRRLAASRSPTPAGAARSRPRSSPPRSRAAASSSWAEGEVPRLVVRGRRFLIVHLRMTGNLLHAPTARPRPGGARSTTSACGFDRLRRTPGGDELVFTDPRRFGTGELALGIDARDAFFAARLGRRAARRRVHRRAISTRSRASAARR